MSCDDPSERLAFFRPASLPGTELMIASRTSLRWHMFHERYAFCLFGKAGAGVRYRGCDELVADGSVTVREPGEAHYVTFITKPSEFKLLFIDPAAFAHAALRLGVRPAPRFSGSSLGHDAQLVRALQDLCDAIEGKAAEARQKSRFADWVVAVGRHAAREPQAAAAANGKRALERAKDHLHQHFNESVSLDELAAVANLSRFHLVHMFTREIGMPPHAYQLHVRVARARALLQAHVAAVDVAGRLGFADQSHFTRHFKRIMHLTPSQYAGVRTTADSRW